ncbi:RNA polymerase I-specific transcription-initiation factor-domain-containing protein [Cladorrhinum sp. PSN332]|nr:RNA polymerase I-specific transcription-initiation factor-domain-containing protein [Cladorrhinum sp. PSN332]
MDEKHTFGHSAGRPHNRRPRMDGIIGRLTYTPAHGDGGLGEMRRSRIKDETPHFKQVTPFGTWCPLARINTSHLSEGAPPWRIARQQENWLSEYLPEASIDEEHLEALLLDEIASSQPNSKPSAAETALLFDTGDITDVRDSSHGIIKKQSVLAVASGDSGNILHLVGLTREEWAWDSAGVRVQTHTRNPRLEGEWSEGCMAITLIRFANDPKKSDPVRWLLVQRGVATTVYEPEVRTMPMPSKGVVRKHSSRANSSQIYANPLFTIPMANTGGSLQSDACFSRSDKGLPQLAVVDQCGYWSIWDITGSLRGRPKILTPVPRLCGNSLTGSIPKLPSSPANEPKPHQMIFLTLGTDPSQGVSKRQGTSSQIPGPEPDARRRLLLLSNAKALHLYDFATQSLHPVTHTVLANDGQQIQAIMPSKLNTSHAFILTNTNILWVAAKESIAKPRSKPSTSSTVLTLEILVSCPHLKDSTDPTLRLDVSAGTFINNIAACFVCIWSAKDTELTAFWFLTPDSGLVRYQRELVSIKSPTNFVGLSMMPVGRMIGGDEPTTTAGKAMRDAQLRFFQLLTLGQDLDVHSTLCVWSDQPAVEVPPPDAKVGVEDDWKAEKEHLESSLEGAFAVPDWFDERVAFRRAEGEERVADERKKSEPRVKNAMVLANRLFCEEKPEVDSDAAMDSANEVPFDFIHEVVERESRDGYMPNHSLMELVKLARPDSKILDLARQYASEQPEPQQYTEHWFYTPESKRPVPGFNPDDMAQNIRNLFPRPKRSNSTNKQYRKAVTQQIAAQMFLSNIGITSVPRDWITSERTSSQSQLSSSQPFSSTPHSPTKTSSSQHFYSSQPYYSQPGSPAKSSSQPSQTISTALHLRQYISTSSSASSNDPQLDLTPWELGTNPESITWRPGQDLEADEMISRRNRKIEARRRKRERLSQAIFGEDNSIIDTSEPTAILPSSQLVFSQQVPGSPTFSRSPVRRVPIREGSPLRRDCSHEHHDHGGNGGGAEHDHSDDITPALQFSLYQHIDFDKIVALNEASYGSGKAVIKKTWAERMSLEPEIESDADEQVLVGVSFTGQVKLHSILIRTSDSDSAPMTLKVIINREGIDFGTAEDLEPTQKFELSRTSEVQELPVRRARFSQVRHLTLFFPDNFGDGEEDVTRISYLGFKGEWMQLGRAPQNIVYEAAANPADHKLKGTSVNQMGSGIGGGPK